MNNKSLGQIAHEAFAEIRPGTAKPWHDLNDSTQNDYKAMASAIKDAVLEESLCACPSCRVHHRLINDLESAGIDQ